MLLSAFLAATASPPGWAAGTLDGSAVLILEDSLHDVDGTFTVTSGSLTLSTDAELHVGNLAVNGGRLDQTGDNSFIKIDSAGAFTMTGGTISISDTVTDPVLSTTGVAGTNFHSVNFTGGTLDVNAWDIRSVDSSGIRIGAGVTLTNFNKITYASFQTTGGTDVMLDVTDKTATLDGHVFPTVYGTHGIDINVRANSSGVLTMTNWSGDWADEDDDSDNGGTVAWNPSSGGSSGAAAAAALASPGNPRGGACFVTALCFRCEDR
jgi:hypothetical protein